MFTSRLLIQALMRELRCIAALKTDFCRVGLGRKYVRKKDEPLQFGKGLLLAYRVLVMAFPKPDIFKRTSCKPRQSTYIQKYTTAKFPTVVLLQWASGPGLESHLDPGSSNSLAHHPHPQHCIPRPRPKIWVCMFFCQLVWMKQLAVLDQEISAPCKLKSPSRQLAQ